MSPLQAQAVTKFSEVHGVPVEAYSSYEGLPTWWIPYLDKSVEVRTMAIRAELAMIGECFPRTAQVLQNRVTEVVLVHNEAMGLSRIFVSPSPDFVSMSYSSALVTTGSDGVSSPAFALLPVSVQQIYQTVCNGLTDLYGFGGLYHAAQLTTIAAQIDTYSSGDWFDALASRYNYENTVEIFSSGGAGYITILEQPADRELTDLEAWQIEFKSDEPQPSKHNFMTLLDEWMSVAL